jgi:hypothetical protein
MQIDKRQQIKSNYRLCRADLFLQAVIPASRKHRCKEGFLKM